MHRYILNIGVTESKHLLHLYQLQFLSTCWAKHKQSLDSPVFRQTHTESIYGSCRKTCRRLPFFQELSVCELLSRQNRDAYTIPLLTMTTDRCSISNLRSHESVKLRGLPCLPSLALGTQRLPSCLSVFRFVWFLRRDILLFVIVIGPRTNPSIFGLPKQTPPKGGGKQRKQERHALVIKRLNFVVSCLWRII